MEMSTTSTTLPPELFDIVLDFLHSDKDTLMACSLTCKAWLTASQYHLFNEIVFTPPDILAFLEFVDSSSSNIATVVRRLVIRRSVYSMIRAFAIKHAMPTTRKLNSHFRGLQSLTLSEIFWGVLPPDIRHLLLDLVTVKDLNLHRVNFETMHQVLEFICAFPALESMSLMDWTMQFPFVDTEIFLVTAAKLSLRYPLRVHLDCINLDRPKSILHFMEWLVVQDPSPLIQLDTLRLGPLTDLPLFALPCIHKFMRMINLSLVQLHIRVPQLSYTLQEMNDYLRHLIGAINCREIRSLSFDLILMSPPPDETTPFRIGIIPKFLTQVPCYSLQQISLAFVITEGSHIGIFDWQGVANILTQHHFGDLQQIRITIHLAHDEDDGRRRAEAIIRESAFSIFDARRILNIEFRGDIVGIYY